MRLSELRYSKGLMQKHIVQAATERGVDVDVPLYSKMEAYKCLPVPAMLNVLCDVLDASPSDIYEPREMDLLGAYKARDGRKGDRHKNTRRISFRLSEAFASALDAGILRELGYKDAHEWFNMCAVALLMEWECLKRRTG